MRAKNSLLLLCLLPAVLLSGGCFTFHKKDKVKENPHIVLQVEEAFMQRWIEHRANEMMQNGMAPDKARSQAISEFRQQFKYTSVAHQ